MNSFRLVKVMLTLALLIGGLTATAYFLRQDGSLLGQPSQDAETTGPHEHATAAGTTEKVLLSEQAQKNLRLTARALKPETFWKTITVPGMVVDRPGYSDRGVVVPLTGLIKTIHHFPGDTVKSGDPLFTVRILSETLHSTQTELFKSVKDITLAQAQRTRLLEARNSIPEARIIEVDNQITRLQTAVKAYKQELLNRGLTNEQVGSVSEGKFVAEITIHVPPHPKGLRALLTSSTQQEKAPSEDSGPTFEVQELRVELGQQVQAGQTLCTLANHQMLAIEGKAFREETPLLERVVREDWPITVDFQEERASTWPTLDQKFVIKQLSNTIDPTTRTFTFLIPFENQSRAIEREGRTIMLWRFRPGHQVRLQIRVEELKNVFVLHPDAVVREGGEAYVFRQNGDVFERKPVHVVYQDRQNIVVANDGSVPAGLFIAQTGAVQLNRMVKAQSGTMPKGFHIHADGSVHFGSH
ncbi:MAG: efflux RND transporter periplasmic adaptor subunit [Gemmataceae bacterium]